MTYLKRTINTRLARAMKSYRQEKGLTVAASAKEIGVSMPTLCHINRGNKMPRRTTIIKICNWMGLHDWDEIKYFFG